MGLAHRFRAARLSLNENTNMTHSSVARRIIEDLQTELKICLTRDAEILSVKIIEGWLDHRDTLGGGRWNRFKRWWKGGYEYGHTGGEVADINRILYRRSVRSRVVEMRLGPGWVPIHESHWKKFVPVEIQ